MRLLLGRLQQDVGITTILATRNQADALALSTRIAVLSEGRVCQEGKPQEIYWRPRNRFVAEFVGAANLIPVRVVEVRELGVVVQTAGGAQMPVASGGRAWTIGARGLLCLRPEALAVEESALARGWHPRHGGGADASRARGSCTRSTSAGGDAASGDAHLRVTGGDFKPGDQVKVEMLPESAVLLPDEGPERAPRREAHWSRAAADGLIGAGGRVHVES